MHELSLATSVVDFLEGLSKEQGLKKIQAVYIEIGGMTHVDPAQFRFSLKLVSQGTVVEGCKIYIKKRDPVLRCNSCGKEVKVNVRDLASVSFKCPLCGGELKIEKGKELLLKRIKGTK
ncbi:MAG: hydrogenase maturation nickel metallochaperone HypA [Candidatus Methanomethyliaceae archaeon]|nr:hydrogenase maturation nickel metallochaperone HypA [Candidatus Methanomethyliaceae archaeon]